MSNAEGVEITLLRPASYKNFISMLEKNYQKGTPFDICHFDGHGLIRTSPVNDKPEGVLCFDGDNVNEQVLVSGKKLGRIFNQYGVYLVTMNACRSGYSYLSDNREETRAAQNIYAFSSLASSLILEGVPAVLAMGYNVSVDIAKFIIENLYKLLFQGATLSEAINIVRRLLLEEIKKRDSGGLNWLIPIVYEQFNTLSSLNKKRTVFSMKSKVSWHAGSVLYVGERQPENAIEHVGYDEAILELEKHYVHNHIVLMTGLSGAGKSSLALEFARWITITNGWSHNDKISCMAIFINLSSFNNISDLKKKLCSKLSLPWEESARLSLAEVFFQIQKLSLFLILDNCDSVFADLSSNFDAWSYDERTELVNFVYEVTTGSNRCLLVARDLSCISVFANCPKILLRGLSQDARQELAEKLGLRNVLTDEWHFVEFLDWSMGLPQLIKCCAQSNLTPEKFDIGKMREGRLGEEVSAVLFKDTHFFVDISPHPNRFYAVWFLSHFKAFLTSFQFTTFNELVEQICHFSTKISWEKISDVLRVELGQGLVCVDPENRFYILHPLVSALHLELFNDLCVRICIEQNGAVDPETYINIQANLKRPVINSILVVSALPQALISNRFDYDEMIAQNLLFGIDISIGFGFIESAVRLASNLRKIFIANKKEYLWVRCLTILVEYLIGMPKSVIHSPACLQANIRLYQLLLREESLSLHSEQRKNLQELEVALRNKGMDLYIDEKTGRDMAEFNANQEFSLLIAMGEKSKSREDTNCIGFFQKAYVIAINNGDKARASNAKLREAKCYLHLSELCNPILYEKCAREAVDLLEHFRNIEEEQLCEAKNSLGNALVEKVVCNLATDNESALAEAESCLVFVESFTKDLNVKASALCGLGNINSLKERFSDSKTCYLQAAELYKFLQSWNNATKAYCNAANAMILDANYAEAKVFMDFAAKTLASASPKEYIAKKILASIEQALIGRI